MLANIQNQDFGYSVAVNSIWAAVGNPSLLRYDPLTSSLTRTGSVEIFKYNINTDTHDQKMVLHRSIDNTEVIFLTTEYNTSSILITPDSILHTEYTGTITFTSDLDIIVNEGSYFTSSEDGYGYSIDIKDNILVVGCPYFRSDFNPSNTQSKTFYGSGSVDVFDLSTLNIDPYATRIPPEIVNHYFGPGGTDFDLIGVSVPPGQNYRYVFLQSKNSGDPISSYQTIAIADTSNLGGVVYLQTHYYSIDEIDIDFRVLGIIGTDPYTTTIYNPNPIVTESFGRSVSINDEWLAVSSPLESGSKGSIFLFRKEGGYKGNAASWSLYQNITPPPEINNGDQFGYSVALNKQSGSYSGSLVVGTLRPNNSRVYEYEYDGINWNQRFTLSPDNTTQYPLTFYPTIPLFSGSFPNTADSFGFDVDIFENTIIVGAPTDRSIYEYSGSEVYKQGSVYFFERCPNPNIGYYLARKSYGNKNIIKNNLLGWSVGIFGQYAVAGIPKINAESASICYLQGSLFQNNFCDDSIEETLNGQYALYGKTVGTLPDTSFIDWDLLNIYQIRKKYLSPYRSFGWDVDISDQFIIVGSPMLIYGDNTMMSFFKEAPFGPIVLSVTSGSAILSWIYTDAEQDGFNIEKSFDGITYGNIDILANASSRSYIDTAVSVNNTYWYRVNAYNGLGVSEYSNTASLFITPSPPSGPVVLQANTGSLYSQSLGSGSSILTWTYTDDFQTGFNIEKSSSATINFVNIDVLNNATSRSYVDSVGIDANKTYLYRVQPFNIYGTGSYSNVGSVSFSNVLFFSGSSKFYVNPTGFITETGSSWKSVTGYKNINLTNLNVSNNSLTTLNLISASSLTFISCSFNQLTSLNLNRNSSIASLHCDNNLLTFIDISGCNLVYFHCHDNDLSSVNVTSCSNLYDFSCNNNLLTSLDVSQNVSMSIFNFSYNQLNYIDVSHNPSLVYIFGDSNLLTSSNLNNPHNSLGIVSFVGNQLSSINLDSCPNIGTLQLQSNLFTDFQHLGPSSASMFVAVFGNNPLTTSFLDMTKYPNVTYLYADNNKITSSFGMFESSSYYFARIFANNFPSLDLQHTPSTSSLTVLDVSINPSLTSLDTSYCVSLSAIGCHQNNFGDRLVLSGSALTLLVCDSSNITNFALSGSPNLTNITANHNSMSSGVVNKILIDLDNFGLFSGSVQISGSDMGVPTGSGITSRTNLVAKDWAIIDSSGTY